MVTVRKALFYSILMQYSGRLLGLISTMVVSRLLTPSEVGTFAIASAAVVILNEFKLLGASSWVIREKEISSEKIRKALALTILVSWSLGFSIILCSSALADFFGLEPLETLFKILAIGFFLAPYISIPMALLARKYDYRSQFIIDILATIGGIAITLALIIKGFSFYSLAWGYAATMFLEFILVMFFKDSNFAIFPLFKGMGDVARFGILNSATNMMRRASLGIPDIIIGKFGSTFQVGVFSRGLGFVEFVNQTLVSGVSAVVLPYFAKERRDGNDINSSYIRASSLIGGLVWPALAVTSLASLPAIRLFFGDQWDAAAPLASYLAVWAMFRAPHWFLNELLITTGKEKIMLGKEFLIFSFLVIGMLISYNDGLQSITYVFIASGVVELLLGILILKVTVNMLLTDFCLAWLKNVFVTMICVLVTLGIDYLQPFGDVAAWKSALFIVGCVPAVWLLALRQTAHELYNEIFLVSKGLLPPPKPNHG